MMASVFPDKLFLVNDTQDQEWTGRRKQNKKSELVKEIKELGGVVRKK